MNVRSLTGFNQPVNGFTRKQKVTTGVAQNNPAPVTFRGRRDDWPEWRALSGQVFNGVKAALERFSPSGQKYTSGLYLVETPVTERTTPQQVSKRQGLAQKFFAEAAKLAVKEGDANQLFSVGLINLHGVDKVFADNKGELTMYHKKLEQDAKAQGDEDAKTGKQSKVSKPSPDDRWSYKPDYERAAEYFLQAADVAEKKGDSWTMMNVGQKFANGLRRHSGDRPALPMTPQACLSYAKTFLGKAVDMARNTLAEAQVPEGFRADDKVRYAVGVLRKVSEIYTKGADMDRYDDAPKTFPVLPKKADDLKPLLAKFNKVVS